VVRSMGLGGGDDRVLVTYPEAAHKGSSGFAWQPGPGLLVDVSGSQLVGDTVELDLSVQDVVDTPFTNLRYDEGGAPGIVLNTAPYSPDLRAAFSVLGGPVPGLASEIGAGQTVANQYLLGIDRPGNIQVRAKVYGTGTATGELSREDTTYVVARRRPLEKWEQVATVAGGYAQFHAKIQPVVAKPTQRVEDVIVAAVKKIIPSGGRRKAYTIASPTEAAIARTLGLDEDTLAFLPNDPKIAAKALNAYMYGFRKSEVAIVKEHFGGLADAAVVVPFQYWRDQLTGGPYSTIPVGPALYDAGASAIKGTKTMASEYVRIVSDPHTADYLDQATLQGVTDVQAALAKIKEVAPAKARQFVRRMAEDPVGVAGELGEIHGRVQAQVAIVVAETAITPSKAGALKAIKAAGTGIERLVGLGVAEGDWTLLAMQDFESASLAAKSSKTLQTAAKLGMPAADQGRWAGIVGKLEDFAKSKGINLDLKLSFRPRNVHTAEIPDALGKNMFVHRMKAGDDIDVILGMHPDGLGKSVAYNPKLPEDLLDYPASKRLEIRKRAEDMRAGYKEWFDPKSEVGIARRKGGGTFTGTLDNGATTTKIHMKLKGVEKNGTIMVQYEELTVDGAKIVKAGDKPRWMGSDYDGNAFLQVNGKDLPPSVRGVLETELMRLQREASVSKDGITGMATSYHGFTNSGFDISASGYRRTFKFLLEGMDDKQAKRALDLYLKKYGNGADYQALLGNYRSGDYVIQVTRDGAAVAQGL
jgi:hypothetical protein